ACSGARRRSTAQERDERAPPHSITSSARAMRVGGTARPSSLAVFRLIASSNLVGAWIGNSAGGRARVAFEDTRLQPSARAARSPALAGAAPSLLQLPLRERLDDRR